MVYSHKNHALKKVIHSLSTDLSTGSVGKVILEVFEFRRKNDKLLKNKIKRYMDNHSNQEQPRYGVEVIKTYLKTLPDKSGVYRMLGESDKVLYVGKAKNLKARVTSYTRLSNLNNRILKMVSQTCKMMFEQTATEAEAFLLEADLIKSLKPHFNVLLKDDKTFPYVLIRKDHIAPQLTRYRGRKSVSGHYFGPFPSGYNAQKILEVLQKVFLLRTCTDSVYQNRSRPCLLFQIKRCSAPCTAEISYDDYQKDVALAIEFMTHGSKKITKLLTDEMYRASDNMDFEKAAEYRDRLKAISQVGIVNDFHPSTFSEADIFVLYREGDMVCIRTNVFRAGQNWGGSSYFPRVAKEMSDIEILDGFLGQFYQNRIPPRLVLLSSMIDKPDLLSEALLRRYDVHVKIEVPIRGEKHDFIKKISFMAQSELQRKKLETGTQQQLIQDLADILGIDNDIQRIEVYDNAHISGKYPVGAMIVATVEGFDKKEYRTWKFKNPETRTDDDYAMMREVFTRRFERLSDEMHENPEKTPDLIIIDGGLGQLNVVMEIAEKLGITIPLVAVAKGKDRNAGRERFFLPHQEPFQLEINNPVLYYVQRLRDEAHRHANGTHAKKRDKAKDIDTLDEITGIGTTRKKALIAHFGSTRAVSEATLEQLLQVKNISSELANKVYSYFNK